MEGRDETCLYERISYSLLLSSVYIETCFRDKMLAVFVAGVAWLGVAGAGPALFPKNQEVIRLNWAAIINGTISAPIQSNPLFFLLANLQKGQTSQVTLFNTTGQKSLEPGNGVNLCQSPEIDAAVRIEDGRTYVFKDDYYWLISNRRIASGYPKQISQDWGGLPGHLDAAYTASDGLTYFFKGTKYWRFRNRIMYPDYPKEIRNGFPGLPDDLDAAILWGENKKPYFFKGSLYWRFDKGENPPVKKDYPVSITGWEGIPSNLSAAVLWENNQSYFFKGKNYYKFDDKTSKVAKNWPGYPRPTSVWWFGCNNGCLLSSDQIN